MAKENENMVVEKEAKTASFSLPNKKVKIIKVVKKGWLPEGHEAAFLFGDVPSNGYTLPRLSNGTYVNPLTPEEQHCLETHPNLSLKIGDLSIHRKKEDNYWTNMKPIKLRKDDVLLNLADPMDYLKYKVLITNKDEICGLDEDPRGKATYKYAIVDLDYADSKKSNSADLYTDAAIEFGKIRNDRNALADICFLLTNRRVSKDVSMEWLKGEVGDIMQKNPKRFLNIVQDEDLQLKVLLEKAVTYKAVQKDGTIYRTKGGDLMGSDKATAILFLKNPSNSDHRMVIEEMVRRSE